MVQLRTAKIAGKLDQSRTNAVRAVPLEAESSLSVAARLADWCERHGHPHSRLSAGECCCGFVRYDD